MTERSAASRSRPAPGAAAGGRLRRAAAQPVVSPHPDDLMTHRLEPLAADRTRVECSWYFPPEAAGLPGFDPAYATDFWDR